MRKLTTSEAAELIGVVDLYNDCFYNRDINALKDMYVSDGDVVFFDNHSACDTHKLSDHLQLVSEFFESGKIVELEKENIEVFSDESFACITLTLRYSTSPKPGVRTTMVLEKETGTWKIRHMHHSIDPNEV